MDYSSSSNNITRNLSNKLNSTYNYNNNKEINRKFNINNNNNDTNYKYKTINNTDGYNNSSLFNLNNNYNNEYLLEDNNIAKNYDSNNMFYASDINDNKSQCENYDYNNNSNVNNQFYDIEAEHESLSIIKSQNSKMKTLFKELEKREIQLKSLKETINNLNNNNGVISNNYEKDKKEFDKVRLILKDQIKLLENQVVSLEESNKNKDKINNNNIDKFSKKEDELILELKNRDAKIKELNTLINEKDTNINNLTLENNNYANIIKLNEKSFNENYNIKEANYNAKIEELNNAIEELIINKDNLNKELTVKKEENNKASKKTEQLIEIVKSQATELQEMSNIHSIGIEENKNLKVENNKLINKIKELEIKIDDIKNKNEEIILKDKENHNKIINELKEDNKKEINNSLNKQIKKYENLFKKYNDLINTIKEKDNEINNIINENNSKIKDIQINNSKELNWYKEEIEKLNNKINTTYKEKISNLQCNIDAKINSEFETSEDIKMLVEVISKDVKAIIEFVLNYFSNINYSNIFICNSAYTNNNINKNFINQFLNNCSSQLNYNFKYSIYNDYLKSKINFKLLFESIVSCYNIICKELNNNNKECCKLNSEIRELSDKYKLVKTENSSLKQEIIENIKEITSLKASIKLLKEDKINKDESIRNYTIKFNEKILNSLKVLLNSEEEIKQILNNLDYIKNHSISNKDFTNKNSYNILNYLIDYDDLKRIFKFNYSNCDRYNNSNNFNPIETITSNSDNNSNEIHDFKINYDLNCYKDNMNNFFSLFKCITEEYMISINKLSELYNIKEDVENIQKEFSSNKMQMLKENNAIKEKNMYLERYIHKIVKAFEYNNYDTTYLIDNNLNSNIDINDENIEKLLDYILNNVFTSKKLEENNDLKSKINTLKKEILTNKEDISNKNTEILLLESQLENADNKYKKLLNNKIDSENKLKSNIDEINNKYNELYANYCNIKNDLENIELKSVYSKNNIDLRSN